MAQSPDEIAKDIVVAWLSHNQISHNFSDPEKAGEAIGIIYKAVLQAVREGAVPASSVTAVPVGVPR